MNVEIHPPLPQFVTSSVATHLERLCFDKWEFFPGIDWAIGHAGHDGPHGSPTSPEQFLTSILALLQDPPSSQPPNPLGVEIFAQEHSDQLLRAYCRVLDNVFEGLGGKMTPALRVIQFDLHAGRPDLPDNCLGWWSRWLQNWRAIGLRLEGSRRVPL
jgi:hypothetical protein